MHATNPDTPAVKKVCLDSGITQYQFKHWKGGFDLEWEVISRELHTDRFSYENTVWARDGDKYFDVIDSDMSDPAPIANASQVCRRTATELDSATQAAVASSTAWQQVVNRDQTYAQQAAAFNRWHREHCVPGGTVDCGATYPTLAETCALNPGLELSTGEDC